MSAVMPVQTFEQRLMGRIKESMGDLMTEADLKKIVDRATEEILFKPRVSVVDTYGRTETKPPLVQEIMEKLLVEHMRAAVEQWLKDNQDKVQPAIEKVIKEGAGKALLMAFDGMMEYSFQSMGRNLMETMRRGG